MSMTDPIADMLTRIRNGQKAGKSHVNVPASRIKEAILDGEITNDFEPAYRLMVKKGLELGFTVKHPLQKKNG